MIELGFEIAILARDDRIACRRLFAQGLLSVSGMGEFFCVIFCGKYLQ